MDDKDALLAAMWNRAMQEISHTSTAARTTAVIVVLAMLGLAYRLLAERQRRATFDHIFTNAPEGSVILQEKSPAGPAMWVWVGESPRPVALERVKCVVVVSPPARSMPVERRRSARRDT
jgi:hypothetical protein